jgi:4-amino-4-deoxy-L-arabinose transferase-like glycosyltransferase
METPPEAGRAGVNARRRLARTGVAAVVLALLLLSAGLRLYRLESQPAWDNEAFSMVTSRLSTQEMNARLVRDFIHPPLYQYALHWWFGIFGFGVFQARVLSAVFGVAAVGMMYWLGSLIFGRRTGLVAALLLAVSQLGVEYSQESRSYAMTMCVGIFTTVLFWLALRRRTKALWLGFLLSAVLLVYLHYLAGLSVACLFCYALLARVSSTGTLAPEASRRTRRPIPIGWLLSGALLIVVAFIPWFAMGILQVAANSPKAMPRVQPPWFAVSWSTFIRDINRFNDGGFAGPLNSAPVWSYAAGAMLFGIPVLLSLRPLLRSRHSRAWKAGSLMAALWLVPHIVLIGLGALGMQYTIRYVLFALPPYYVLAARGIAGFPPRWRRVHLALIAVYAICSVSVLYRTPYKENYRDAAVEVARDYRPGDICVFPPFGDVPLQWSVYYGDRPLNVVSPADLGRSPRDTSRIWVVYWVGTANMKPLNQSFHERIAASHEKVRDRKYFMVDLALYVPKRAGGR